MTSRSEARLLQLGAQFEAAWAAEGLAFAHSAKSKGADSKAADKRSEQAFHRTSRIVSQIERLQAHTIEGLRVKARAVSWCHSGDHPVDFADDAEPTTDMRLAQGIINDLLAVQRP